MQPAPIEDVLRRHRERLLAQPGVTAVAESERGGRPCVLVLVERLTQEVAESIPSRLEGHPVALEEGGPFRRLE